ncbi:MAG TPA: hypothetical protein VJ998_06775 [Pseudomonadales bacterium]|nr:hypothetical protein [Pseudomonadales bacterium]
MKIFKSGVLVAMAAWFAMQAGAAEVDSASVTTFQPGTTLSSQELNTSISALITAINDNASRVAALEETQNAATTVSGKQYCVHSIETGFFLHSPLTNPNGIPYPLGVSTASFVAGVSFNADGSGTVMSYEDDYKEGFPGSSVFDQGEPLGSQGFTWTLTGHKLVVTLSATDIAHFAVAKGGSVLLSGQGNHSLADDGSGTWYTTNHATGLEVDDASNCNGIFQ